MGSWHLNVICLLLSLETRERTIKLQHFKSWAANLLKSKGWLTPVGRGDVLDRADLSTLNGIQISLDDQMKSLGGFLRVSLADGEAGWNSCLEAHSFILTLIINCTHLNWVR